MYMSCIPSLRVQVAPEAKYRFKLRNYVATEAEKATYVESFVHVRHQAPKYTENK